MAALHFSLFTFFSSPSYTQRLSLHRFGVRKCFGGEGYFPTNDFGALFFRTPPPSTKLNRADCQQNGYRHGRCCSWRSRGLSLQWTRALGISLQRTPSVDSKPVGYSQWSGSGDVYAVGYLIVRTFSVLAPKYYFSVSVPGSARWFEAYICDLVVRTVIFGPDQRADPPPLIFRQMIWVGTPPFPLLIDFPLRSSSALYIPLSLPGLDPPLDLRLCRGTSPGLDTL